MKPVLIFSSFVLVAFFAKAQTVDKSAVLPQDTLQVKEWLKQALSPKTNATTATQLAVKALQLSEKNGYHTGIGEAGTWLGEHYFKLGAYIQALEYFEKAKSARLLGTDEFHAGQVYKLIGDVHAKRNFFRQANENYREASTLLRKTNQLKLLNECQDAMGKISLDFGRYPNAINIYKRSLAVKTSLNDEKGKIQVLEKLSAAYIGNKQYDSALYFNKELKNLVHNDVGLYSNALLQESVIYCFLGNTENAAASRNKATLLINNQPQGFDKTSYYISGILYATTVNDEAQVRKYLDSVGRLLQGSQNPETAFTGLNYLAELRLQKGNYKGAYDALKTAEVYKDRFRSADINRMSAEVENATEISLKEKEIEYLNLVNRLKAEKLSKEELQRMALLRENILKDSSLANQRLLMEALETEAGLRNIQLDKEKELTGSLERENELKQKLLNDERRNKKLLWLGFAVVSLLGGIVFYQFKKQQRKNQIINKQSAELEVLNKEIHHRVKNNLQVISSMLDLQSQSLNDEKAAAIIKEGIQRVQSMAFIHQNLYQGNAVNSVNMHEYIRMLSSHLFQTYNIRPDKIKMHTDIDNISLHTDTAIPLGMILNELISNSLKYAFKSREKGNIWVVMKRNENELLLQVTDDGIGLAKDFTPDKANSFGYEIIKAFAQKMKARINIDGSNGTDVQVIISKFKTTS